MADEVTIRAQALDGTWETIGSERGRGIRPANVELQADVWGPSKATFELRRDPRATWPDIGAFTPVEVEVDGMVVWDGRVLETPSRDSAERVMSVECEGWQFHLDDDLYEWSYVHADVSAWRDQRSFLGANLLSFTSMGKVTTDRGIATIGFAKGDEPISGACVGITLDLGPSGWAKKVVIDADRINGGPGETLIIRGHATDDATAGSPEDAASGPISWSTPTTISGTFATAWRYVTIFLTVPTAFGSPYNEDPIVRLKAIRVFADTAYESGGQSILKASTVWRHALSVATLLNTDRSGVEDTVTSIPSFVLDGNRTPRQVGDAVNALHNWLMQIAVGRRPIFRAFSDLPELEIGAWPGSTFEDTSANSGEEIYNRVVVVGQDTASNPIREVRGGLPDTFIPEIPGISGSDSIVDRRRFNRAREVPVRSPVNTAIAAQIGDIWLDAHRSTPLKGESTVTRGGLRSIATSENVHPAVLLLKTGELLRLGHVIDPDTGGLGRDARIAGVTYRPAVSTAAVDLSNKRADVEALLERLAVVTGA